MPTKETITNWFQNLQDHISQTLEDRDGGAKFREDKWQRHGGGGGRSRILNDGKIIQKGGVNFSAVHGELPDKILKALNLPKAEFYATGVSIVIHPRSPMIPIIHMNVRYFEMSDGRWWFGGGIDLTPHYVKRADAHFFHNELKKACDLHDATYYDAFKKWADDYFYIKHRKETRGVGGIFFDRLSQEDEFTKDDRFDFVKSVGNSFLPIYLHLIDKNIDCEYGQKELLWQNIRRSRYVEFNLVYDKGTKFGLDTDGRTESILMSMPPVAEWKYDFQVSSDSAERETLDWLKKGVDWASSKQ